MTDLFLLGLMWTGVVVAVLSALYAALWVLRLLAAHVVAWRARRSGSVAAWVEVGLVDIRVRRRLLYRDPY